MGRKLKGKGRGGIKDPLKQQRVKLEKIKDKINNPPKNFNLQELPVRFKKLSSLSKPSLLQKKKKKKNLKNKNTLLDTAKFAPKDVGFYPRNGKPCKPIPTVQQKPQEPYYKFMERVSHVTQMVIKEAQMEDKFKVDTKRSEKGKIVGYDERKMKPKSEHKILKQKERDMKRKLKKQKIKMKKNLGSSKYAESEDEEDREANLFQKDNVQYGEVVHEPPTLETEKLEKRVLKTNVSNYLFIQNLNKTQSGTADERKVAARKKMIEIEREKAILAYRQLKSQKYEALRPKITTI